MAKTKAYVSSVCIGALALSASVYILQRSVQESELTAVIILGALATLAEMLTVVLPRSAKGSMAFIPYLAAVMVVPSWPTIAVAGVVKVFAELVNRRDIQKRAFNTAQLICTLSIAVLVFRALGGAGMLNDGVETLAATTTTTALPALVAFIAAFLVNSLLVQGIVAIVNGITLRQAIRENVLTSIGFDLMASPIVFVFAWVYAEHGAVAAFAIWVPVVGFRQLTKTKLELEQTNQELLQLMVKSIEARDPYTSGHSRRVEAYAILIARGIGLAARDISAIGKAALLHDVGKIYEKYAPILAKPDKLTPDEWNTMKQHPIDGAELVATMTHLRDLIPAVRHHHEKWDGSGYPDGLKESAIPLGARIIALADTIDAMTSERPYRRAMSAEEVRREVLKERGRQFDPAIVDQLLSGGAWNNIFAPTRIPPFGELSVVSRSDKGGRLARA